MSLVTIDPNVSTYEAKQMLDPNFLFEVKKVRREYVEAVDVLLKHIGNRDTISSNSDWEALDKVISFYCSRWPDDWAQFKDSIVGIRQTRRDGGYSESKDTKYVAALPPKLERLIKVCFPFQEFNKTFIYKLIDRIKIFKVGGEQ